MREIRFRGKRKDNGEWVHGLLSYESDGVEVTKIIVDENGYSHYVDLNTIGQYTGLKDKNGKEIYEGDKVNCWGGECCQGYWEFNDTIAVNDIRDYVISGILGESEYIDVIGNIHDNPELLVEVEG